MRILFDGFWWVDGPYANRQVLKELIYAWEREFDEDELLVAVPRSSESAVRADLPARVRLVTTRLRPQGISAIVELPLLARRMRPDVTISHNFSPMFGPSAVFVHDLMFETNPEWFTLPERAYFSLMTRTVPRADLVATSSATEAGRIAAVARPRSEVVPIGMGVPSSLVAAGEHPVAEARDLDGFILIVGRLNVRKNLATGIEGALCSGRIGPRFPVLVVGEPGGKGAELSATVRRGIDEGAVRFLGFVSDAELAWLYRSARLFMFVSRGEGFGIPTIEALSYHVPILASDIPVFREILGDHADYVDPDNPATIGRAVADILGRVERGWSPDRVSPSDLGYDWSRAVHRFRTAVGAALTRRSGRRRRWPGRARRT